MIKTLTFTILMSVTALIAQIPTNGLIAYYPFNGNANDFSGNAINGTISNAVSTFDRFGNLNSAYAFNGTNSYIQFSDTKLPSSNSQRTFSVWVNFKNASVNGFGTILGYGGSDYGSYNHLLIADNNKLDYNFHNYSHITDSTIKQNEWVHLVFVSGFTLGSQKIYRNTKLSSTQVANVSNTVSSINTILSGNMYVGKSHTSYSNGNYYNFNGAIDDIRVYNRILTDNEILALFNEGKCNQSISVADTLRISSTLSSINNLPPNFGTIKIYPNPTKDILNIRFDNPSNNYSFKMTDSNGFPIIGQTLKDPLFQIYIDNYPKGLYFIQILDITNNILETKKIIIE